MRSFAAVLVTTFLVLSLAPASDAHHGKDFLLVESYELPHPGDFYLFTSHDWIAEPGPDLLHLEPALLLGLTSFVATELHAHIEKQTGEAFRYESTAIAARTQITPDDWRWGLGLSAEYERAYRRADGDRAEMRLIADRSFDPWRLSLNVIGDFARHETGRTGYAAGARFERSKRFAYGLEGQGEISHAGAHELLAAVYGEPSERITLKLGAGPGFGPGSADFIVRSGFVFRF